MRIIIAPTPIGFSLAAGVCRELYTQRPDFFEEPMALDAFSFLDEFTAERTGQFFGSSFVEGDMIYFLKNDNPQMRTWPWLIEQIEKRGSAAVAGRFCKIFKVVDVPDDVHWYIAHAEDGSESIHENHRVWQ